MRAAFLMRPCMKSACLAGVKARRVNQPINSPPRERCPKRLPNHRHSRATRGNNNVLDKPAQNSSVRTSGPLTGFRVVEFAGIGPGPFACMMLADMGAEVVTLDRVGAKKSMKSVAGRGRKLIELDLKDKVAVAQVLDLLGNADALIEGFR